MDSQTHSLTEGTLVYITPLERDGDTTAVRGEVVEVTRNSVLVDYVDDVCAPSGSMVQIGFQSRQRFVTAPARIVQLVHTAPKCRIHFSLDDTFKANDHRGSFRVPAAGSRLRAIVNDDEECPILDISARGLSILSAADYRRGLVISLTFSFDTKEYSGRAIIRNVSKGKKDRSRFGLEVIDGEQKLLQGLQHVSVTVQREQIRRMRAKGMQAA